MRVLFPLAILAASASSFTSAVPRAPLHFMTEEASSSSSSVAIPPFETHFLSTEVDIQSKSAEIAPQVPQVDPMLSSKDHKLRGSSSENGMGVDSTTLRELDSTVRPFFLPKFILTRL